MNISIFGMGYVGAVSGACLAELGHRVVGVDLNPKKVELLAAGRSPIVEEDIDGLIAAGVRSGNLRATTDATGAVRDTEVSFVSVGTPSAPSGAVSLTAVDAVVAEIGAAIRAKDSPHTVVLRSTVTPGTTEDHIRPLLEQHTGREIGDRLELCFNPEFLREGSSVRDFREPPFTIVGSVAPGGFAVLDQVYEGVGDAPIHTSCRVAESAKYLSNIYHAVKITFANEVGAALKAAGVDAREAMELFCRDDRLNISKAYLRPGFAFGGSCLPKDLRAFLSLARGRDVELPFLSQLLPANQRHVERAFALITARGRRKVALFGLAFKAGTDDLRESPLVALAERLIGKGYQLSIYDADVQTARLIGANREYIEREIPHFDRLLCGTPADALSGAEIVVVGHAGPDVLDAIRASCAGRTIVDLAGIDELRNLDGVDYEGICW